MELQLIPILLQTLKEGHMVPMMVMAIFIERKEQHKRHVTELVQLPTEQSKTNTVQVKLLQLM